MLGLPGLWESCPATASGAGTWYLNKTPRLSELARFSFEAEIIKKISEYSRLFSGFWRTITFSTASLSYNLSSIN